MKVSLAWIQEFTDIDTSVEELVELIGSRLVEVEDAIDWGARFQGILVGEIIEVKTHDNADKLNIYQVKVGQDDVRQVVSGDKTLQMGDKVGYIPPGATVPSTYDTAEPFVISEISMRGVVSQGMLGSARELCLGDDHSKVQVLDTEADAGETFADAYSLNDIILDIENKSFTHRPDCFGLLGVAREVAAIQGKAFQSPAWFTTGEPHIQKSADLPLVVKNDIPELVPRFTAVTIKNVTLGPSPLMLQSMLTRLGVRPINNVVDVTNYIMLLTGQPLHAYDYDKVAALMSDGQTPTLTVRHPRAGETLMLLDGKEITPHGQAMVVAAGDTLACLGGMMGGANTEVDAQSKNIILEAANWDMYAIRRTSMQHGIFSEAVTRFAKGQSPSITAPTIGHALGMLLEASPSAEVASELIDAYPEPKEAEVIETSSRWVNQLLGTSLETDEIVATLRNVECQVEVHEDDLSVTPPLWRSDLHIAEDITDEIGRLYGFDNIEPTLPMRSYQPTLPHKAERLKHDARLFLRDAGANEVLTYSFVSERLMQQTMQEVTSAFHLVNSLSPELAYLRTNLLGSLLSKVHGNHKAGYEHFALFEFGKTQHKEEMQDDGLPVEHANVALVWSAEPKAYATSTSGAPFYQAKHYVETLAKRLGIHGLHYRLVRPHTLDAVTPWIKHRVGMFDLNRSAVIMHNDVMIGIVGEPAAEVRRAFKLPAAVSMFECNVHDMVAAQSQKPTYRPLSRFPTTTQDVSYKVAADQQYENVVMAITDFLKHRDDVVFGLEPLDIFVPEGQDEYKHVTVRLELWNTQRTLTTSEVNDLFAHLDTHMRTALRATRV